MGKSISTSRTFKRYQPPDARAKRLATAAILRRTYRSRKSRAKAFGLEPDELTALSGNAERRCFMHGEGVFERSSSGCV